MGSWSFSKYIPFSILEQISEKHFQRYHSIQIIFLFLPEILGL